MTESAFPLTLRVDGVGHELLVGADDTLLDVLHDRLRLHSCRETCGIGVCGSCTVRVDGRAVSACLTMAFTCADADVETAEGTAVERVRQAFLDHQAFQCSYCTPGFVMSVAAMLDEPTERRDVDAALSGHLCRCASYRQIRAAVEELLDT
ncbi:MAG: 2Fe-2S iron-sulfur cluster binding domain-containing protein [Streptosporangiales bacterium]|nr:2Fe-2S iron-sulfur cluster binding domain-containing protein [Streptosporangiales bacterium]MBO0890447.1 2Fe-2S iron-sulfur cluster binding domain-containing protein [Acidothermales bacterium]